MDKRKPEQWESLPEGAFQSRSEGGWSLFSKVALKLEGPFTSCLHFQKLGLRYYSYAQFPCEPCSFFSVIKERVCAPKSARMVVPFKAQGAVLVPSSSQGTGKMV